MFCWRLWCKEKVQLKRFISQTAVFSYGGLSKITLKLYSKYANYHIKRFSTVSLLYYQFSSPFLVSYSLIYFFKFYIHHKWNQFSFELFNIHTLTSKFGSAAWCYFQIICQDLIVRRFNLFAKFPLFRLSLYNFTFLLSILLICNRFLMRSYCLLQIKYFSHYALLIKVYYYFPLININIFSPLQ